MVKRWPAHLIVSRIQHPAQAWHSAYALSPALASGTRARAHTPAPRIHANVEAARLHTRTHPSYWKNAALTCSDLMARISPVA
jgi:hypothetical protein